MAFQLLLVRQEKCVAVCRANSRDVPWVRRQFHLCLKAEMCATAALRVHSRVPAGHILLRLLQIMTHARQHQISTRK